MKILKKHGNYTWNRTFPFTSLKKLLNISGNFTTYIQFVNLNVSKHYSNRFLKERAKIQKAEETDLAKQRDNQLERIAKEKDAELNRQVKAIQEIEKESELGKQTKEMERNKTIDSIEYKMDLMENKINEILSLLNKGQGAKVQSS